MAENSRAMIGLAEKHEGGNFLRELGQWALRRLMEMEAQAVCGAGLHERSTEHANRRNSYRARRLGTRIGALDLRIPKLRSGSFFPSFLDSRRMSEKALVAVVQEPYVKGRNMHKVDDLVL